MAERQYLRRQHERFAVGLDIAERLERYQRAPHGGARQFDPPRDLGERHAVRMRAESANDLEPAGERGDKIGLFNGVDCGETKQRLVHDRAFGYRVQPTTAFNPRTRITLRICRYWPWNWAKTDRCNSRILKMAPAENEPCSKP